MKCVCVCLLCQSRLGKEVENTVETAQSAESLEIYKKKQKNRTLRLAFALKALDKEQKLHSYEFSTKL